MADKLIENVQTQLMQLAVALPDVKKDERWAEIIRNVEHLSETVRRQSEQLSALQNINLQVSNQFDLDTLLNNVALFSTKLLKADSSVIRLVDSTQELFNINAVNNPPKGIRINQTEKFGVSPSSQVVKSWQAILANDWPHHPLAKEYPLYTDEANQILAIVNVPISIQKTIIGTIEVFSFTKTQAFDENDRYSLSILASQTATVIENTRLFNRAQHSYRFLETVIEHIPDPLFIKNKDNVLLEMNQANAEIIGIPKHEIIGKTDESFFPPDLAAEFRRRLDEIFATNQVLEAEDKIVWGDGKEHIGYTRLVPIPDSAGQPEYLLGITHDITQRRAHELERERFLAETTALYKGSQAISRALSERQIFEALFEQIRPEDPCEISAFTFNTVNEDLIWAELRANWQKKDNHTYPIGTRLHLPETLHARLLTTNEPLFIDDIANDPELSTSEREGFAPTAAKAAAILPLSITGQKIGLITVSFTRPYTFSQDTQRFWSALIDQASMALSNRQLIQKAAYRVVQMETAAEVAQAASSLIDLDDLLKSAVNLIRDHFDLYYVGAFLVDEANEWAELQAGTGKAGRIQLKKKHRLKIGEESMIGWSIYHRQPRIALDVGQDAVHFQNPDLSDTRSEMALPLIQRGNPIGALTVQSVEPAAFSREDIIVLQTMANQLANAIENARLFTQAQQEIEERKQTELVNQQLLAEAQHRSDLLQTAAEVSRAASSILDIDKLINTSVNFIRDQFDFYYVGLFLVDTARKWAVLRAGTGEAGRIQLERNHQLEIGGESMIGWCVQNREARIVLDVGEEAVHFKNPILPDTHSEMALPLISRDEVLGALTVQSVERAAFSAEDIALLQTMADQLANAIANAELFESVAQARKEAESRLQETQALQQLSQNLAETLQVDHVLDIFFQACAKEIGFEYVQFSLIDKYQNRVKAIAGVGIPESQIKRANQSLDSDDIMVDIIKTGNTEIITGWDDRFDKETFETEGHADWARVFTPITLRQENIGLVEAGFNKKTKTTIHEFQVRLLRAFIDQTALALDSAQRYEASQRAAHREALIKDITTKVRASTDLDTILQTTVKELGDAVGSKRTYIHLISSPKTNGHTTTDAERKRGNGGQG